MGQAKQRGTKEQRIAEATKLYEKKLLELNKYGLSMDILNTFCKGDVRIADYYLDSINKISKLHTGADIQLFINGDKISVSVINSPLVETSELQKHLEGELDKIPKPIQKNKFDILFTNVEKFIVDKSYPYPIEKSFDLPLNKDGEFFEKLLNDNFPNGFFEKQAIDYYIATLVVYSNHPFSKDKKQSFLFVKAQA